MENTYDEMMSQLRESALRQGAILNQVHQASSERERDPLVLQQHNITEGAASQNANRLGDDYRTQASTPQPPPRPPRQERSVVNVELSEIISSMTEAFTQALQKVATGGKVEGAMHSIRNSPMHQFHGLEHESASAFLFRMENYFRQYNITNDTDKLITVTSQLQGQAKEWYEPHKNLIYDYDTFRLRLKQTYDTMAKRAHAEHILHSRLQKKNESVTIFIAKKIGLFNRVDPTRPSEEKAHCIYRQLLPEIRAQIRHRDFDTPEELLHLAAEVEENIQETQPWRGNRPSNTAYPNPPEPARNTRPTYNTRQPTQTANTQATTTRNNAYGNANNQPPNPCKFCGGWHWMRHCPQNPYERQTNASQPQNRPTINLNANIQPNRPTVTINANAPPTRSANHDNLPNQPSTSRATQQAGNSVGAGVSTA